MMRDGGVGPFAVVALVIMLGVQAAAIQRWRARSCWPSPPGVRRSPVLPHGVPAARPDGLGALVAGRSRSACRWPWWSGALRRR